MSEELKHREGRKLGERAERTINANIVNRAWYKGFLDLVRNMMVVAALFYLAKKSGDWWLYGIAITASFALMGYCYTYIENFWFAYEINAKGWRWHVAAIAVVLAQVLMMGITAGMFLTLIKIVTVQVETTKGP